VTGWLNELNVDLPLEEGEIEVADEVGCKGLRSGSYRTGILELYSIEKRTTGS
jgi:hypothetical protein